MNEMTDDALNSKKQKYLGSKGLIAFITLMNMFVPLSTDLYLPALPTMSTYFHSTSTITNFTLSSFFFFYAVGILVWGPLSDKYGRKPILILGSILYIVSSISCALSANVIFLIAARALQGIGSGGITSVSAAIIKDCFAGKKREVILAVTQSMSGIAPMVAPIAGAWILSFSNWRGTFWLLTAISFVNLILTIFYQETLKDGERYQGTVAGSISRLFVVGKNPSFIIPAILFSLNAIPFMGYIAQSSYIYIRNFGLTEQTYSYFFATNALISIFGPIIYIRYLSNVNKRHFAGICFAMAALSGILVMSVGTRSPMAFMLSFAILSITATAIRPYSSNILFEQQTGDSGSASSLISTLFMVLGSVGMTVASISWGNLVIDLGILTTLVSLVALVGWSVFIKSKIPCVGVKN